MHLKPSIRTLIRLVITRWEPMAINAQRFLASLAVKVAMAALQPLLTQTAMAFLTPMTIVQTHRQEPQLEPTVAKSTLMMEPLTTAQIMGARPRTATQQRLVTTPAMAQRMG